MSIDLLGEAIATNEDDLIKAFIAEVRKVGRASFNHFRHQRSILKISHGIGGRLTAACQRAGLRISRRTTRAKLAQSHYRLCAAWEVA